MYIFSPIPLEVKCSRTSTWRLAGGWKKMKSIKNKTYAI